MAKVTMPLMSIDASGTVGKAAVFSKWKGRNVVRRHAIPMNPKSSAQVGVRANFAGVNALWKKMTDSNKALWKVLGDSRQHTALNAFMSVAQRNLGALMGIQQLPTLSGAVAPVTPTLLACSVAGTRLTVKWTDDASADAYSAYLYRGAVIGFIPSPGNLVCVVPTGVQAFTDSPGPGTFYYKISSGNTDGVLSAPSASASGTIE